MNDVAYEMTSFVVLMGFGVFSLFWKDPNRTAFALLAFGIALGKPYDAAEAAGREWPMYLDHAGIPVMAFSLLLARPESLLAPDAPYAKRLALNIAGRLMCGLGFALLGWILYPMIARFEFPLRGDHWFLALALAFFAAALSVLGWRTAGLPLRPEQIDASAAPPCA